MPVDQVIHMIAMRHRLVSATGTMDVGVVVARALVARSAHGGILRRYRHRVLLHLTVRSLMVQVPVMQIIDVPLVPDPCVAAVGPVLVVVIGV